MYDERETSAVEKNAPPEIFSDIEVLHKEVSHLENKLRPILIGGGPEKLAGSNPSKTDLDGRIKDVINHLREVNLRIHL